MLLTIFLIIKVSYGTASPTDSLKNTSSDQAVFGWTKYHRLEDHYEFIHKLEQTYPRPGVVKVGVFSLHRQIIKYQTIHQVENIGETLMNQKLLLVKVCGSGKVTDIYCLLPVLLLYYFPSVDPRTCFG